MADYAPRYKPGVSQTSQASATIVGGNLLAVSGSGTVAPTSGATSPAIGVAAFDAASGAKVTVLCGGVQRLVASGAITAGDFVVPASSGRVITQAAGTADNRVVGVALTTAADAALVDVQMER